MLIDGNAPRITITKKQYPLYIKLATAIIEYYAVEAEQLVLTARRLKHARQLPGFEDMISADSDRFQEEIAQVESAIREKFGIVDIESLRYLVEGKLIGDFTRVMRHGCQHCMYMTDCPQKGKLNGQRVCAEYLLSPDNRMGQVPICFHDLLVRLRDTYKIRREFVLNNIRVETEANLGQ